jgi:hypothetical protein
MDRRPSAQSRFHWDFRGLFRRWKQVGGKFASSCDKDLLSLAYGIKGAAERVDPVVMLAAGEAFKFT